MEVVLADSFMKQIVTTVASMLAAGVIGYLMSQLKNKTKKSKAHMEVVKCTARRDILEAYERYVVRGEKMSVMRFDEIKREYDAYKVLGGNGTAENYMREIEALHPYLITK